MCAKFPPFFCQSCNLTSSPVPLHVNAATSGWRFILISLCLLALLPSSTSLLTWWKRDFMGYSFDSEYENIKYEIHTILNVLRILCCLHMNITYYLLALLSLARAHTLYKQIQKTHIANAAISRFKHTSKSKIAFYYLLHIITVVVNWVDSYVCRKRESGCSVINFFQ